MASTVTARIEGTAAGTIGIVLRPLQILLAGPWLPFLAFLASALFRPPGLQFFPWDRFVFAFLVFVAALRVLGCGETIFLGGTVTSPLVFLMLLSLGGIMAHGYDPQAWSVFAAKWLVPFVLFQVAAQLIESPHFLERFETFMLIALAYLIFIAIAFMIGAKGFVFPTFILDEGLGMHADRARGPFLQAVANGVTLNLLGLMALNAYRRRVLRGPVAMAVLAGLPLAIVATKTRSVWLAFAGSILWLLFRASSQRLRRACTGLTVAGAMVLVACVGVTESNRSLAERLEDRSPVEFRMAVYQAGWEMFQAKPLLGWGAVGMQTELSKRISEFHQDEYYFHNTYLEILVERGLLGLGLYAWLAIDLFRVGRKQSLAGRNGFLDQEFRSLWPVLVLVFLVNGSFVVMNYQFVNGLLFSIAGLLAAQNRMEAQRG